MVRQWVLNSQNGFDASLEHQMNVPDPSASQLGTTDVLVRLHGVSLNYRELMIAGPASFSGPISPPVVPCCDGAGVVEAVGSSVKEFQLGDKVVTYIFPRLAEAQGDDAAADLPSALEGLGQGPDGTLRSVAVFSEKALVKAPKHLNHLEASTLTCTWVTAWNALFGLGGRSVGPGSWVLVQGTGGVSVATLQLAVAVGATVVATTSSEERAARLKSLGTAHVVNYRSNPDWGSEARALTPNGRGFDLIVEIGGNETLGQSLKAVRNDGVVTITGGVGTDVDAVPALSALIHTCVMRGILAGSRTQMKELVEFVEAQKIHPAVDDVVFELAEAKQAYRRLHAKDHFSKVVIRIDHSE